MLVTGCVRGGAQTAADERSKAPRPEEVALVDAFGELMGWVKTNGETIDAGQMPICVVLGDSDDPSGATVDLLRTRWRWVEPASSCPFRERNVLIVAADLGERLHDGRLLAHAGFSLGNHAGASWAYRLAPTQGSWSIDARLESRNALP